MTLAMEGLGSKEDAIERFRHNAPLPGSEPTSQQEYDWRETGITDVQLSVDPNAFQQHSDLYGVLLAENIRWLNFTSFNFDEDDVPEDGHVKKKLKKNAAGMQIVDPKSLNHVNNDQVEWWTTVGEREAVGAPSEFKEFMRLGVDIHRQLAVDAFRTISVLEPSYPGMRDFYFGNYQKGDLSKLISNVTYRLLRYDPYPIFDDEGNLVVEEGSTVAKEHFDRGGFTIQAYASAPGFWYKEYDEIKLGDEAKHYPEHGIGKSQAFFGLQHQGIYTKDDLIKPLFHGVDKVLDKSQKIMPVRTAAIAFVDSPFYNLGITSLDTQPNRVDKDNLKI